MSIPSAPHYDSRDAERSLVRWTALIYGLHAFSIASGIVGTATVIAAFLTGWPSLVAVVLNYVKRSDVRGTWLESHFRWQIRTFWYGLLWVIPCYLLLVLTLGLGIIVVWLPLALVTIWFVYRIARGWIRLGARKAM